MNLISSQERIFPSIFIAKTVDLTQTLVPQEKGVIGTIGKLSIGSPYYPAILIGATEPLKSTNINAGGLLENELAYHIRDFFSSFNGKMVIGRVVGADSTTSVLSVVKDAITGVYSIDDTTPINVLGANNIDDWADTAVTGMLEVVVSCCPSDRTTIEIRNTDGIISVRVTDEYGSEIYAAEGGAAFDSVDDSGNLNYIGAMAQKNIVMVKVNSAHADYASDFSVTKTFDNGLIVDAGLKNYNQAVDVLSGMIESCDYAITGGLVDTVAIQSMNAICEESETPLIVDVKANSLQSAFDFKTGLNMNRSGVCFVWNRVKNKFQAGDLSIGLSGWLAGMSVDRNLSKLVHDVEYRVAGIAGVDYEIPRILSDVIPHLSNDDRTALVNNRINTIGLMRGGSGEKLCLIDVLSADPKNVDLRLWPVSEGNMFINTYIARIMISQFFKNLDDARVFIEEEVRKLFDRADRNKYFRKGEGFEDQENRYQFQVTKSSIDEITVSYLYVPEGIMRRGQVRGSVTKTINQG